MPTLKQIWRCDGGFSYNGTNYTFTDLDQVAYTWARKNHLMRGANATNKVGIISQEGLKTPEVAEYTVVDCSKPIYTLLENLYKNHSRVDAWFIDRETGEKITFSNSIIRDMPKQTAVSEDDTSYSFIFAVESFDISEKVVVDVA